MTTCRCESAVAETEEDVIEVYHRGEKEQPQEEMGEGSGQRP